MKLKKIEWKDLKDESAISVNVQPFTFKLHIIENGNWAFSAWIDHNTYKKICIFRAGKSDNGYDDFENAKKEAEKYYEKIYKSFQIE